MPSTHRPVSVGRPCRPFSPHPGDHRRRRALADLRGCSVRRAMSTPDIRVWAVNATNVAAQLAGGPLAQAVAGLGDARRWSAPRASRRRGRTDARRSASSVCRRHRPPGNSAPRRFPSVIVPVLSSSSVFTSPAASTARPDMASTLRCTSRSMPAMPIADSSAPIVVGIRQTRRTTSTMPLTPCTPSAVLSGTPGWLALEKIASGCRVATASRKMTVNAASRMLSAISFGVFCRYAPSTRAIIRSMKLSPGRWVISTTIRSESTRVPPVTARPVPAGLPDHRGRLAGDRRLVHAGHALDDVAVGRDDLPGGDDDVGRPCCSCGAATDSTRSTSTGRSGSRRAAAGPWCRSWHGAASRPGPCRDPRPPPRRGSRSRR